MEVIKPSPQKVTSSLCIISEAPGAALDPKGMVLWVGVRLMLPGTTPYPMRGVCGSQAHSWAEPVLWARDTLVPDLASSLPTSWPSD